MWTDYSQGSVINKKVWPEAGCDLERRLVGIWETGAGRVMGVGGEELRCPEGREVIVATSPYPRSWLRYPVSKCLQLTLSGTSENNIYADIRRGGVNLLTAFLG